MSPPEERKPRSLRRGVVRGPLSEEALETAGVR